MQGMLTPKAYQQAKTLLLTSAIAGAGVVMTLLIGYVMASPTFGWTGAACFAARHALQTAGFIEVAHPIAASTYAYVMGRSLDSLTAGLVDRCPATICTYGHPGLIPHSAPPVAGSLLAMLVHVFWPEHAHGGIYSLS